MLQIDILQRLAPFANEEIPSRDYNNF